MYEHRRAGLLPFRAFVRRVAVHALVAVATVLLSLLSLRALGVVDARARGLVVQAVLPDAEP